MAWVSEPISRAGALPKTLSAAVLAVDDEITLVVVVVPSTTVEPVGPFNNTPPVTLPATRTAEPP